MRSGPWSQPKSYRPPGDGSMTAVPRAHLFTWAGSSRDAYTSSTPTSMTVRTSASPCAGTLKSNGGMVCRPSAKATRLAIDTYQKQVSTESAVASWLSVTTEPSPSGSMVSSTVDGAPSSDQV